MTAASRPSHHAMPAEPAALAELVADAQSLPAALLPRPRRVIDLTGRPHEVVTIPDSAVSLLEGYAEYGA